MENKRFVSSNLIITLSKVQSDLKAPKGQFNKFGNFSYRSCEDIIEAVKPILAKYSLILNINDEVVLIGDRFYIKATAKITDGVDEVSATAYAREPNEQKGMNESQITGSTSSYARKYALNGLLAIDDNKDADTNEYQTQVRKPDANVIKELEELGGDLQMVADYYKKDITLVTNDDVKKLVLAKKKRLEKQNAEMKKQLESKSKEEVQQEIDETWRNL